VDPRNGGARCRTGCEAELEVPQATLGVVEDKCGEAGSRRVIYVRSS
jgi:hypothetical protein